MPRVIDCIIDRTQESSQRTCLLYPPNAGAGKTLLALVMLMNYLTKLTPDDDRNHRLLYVCESPDLAERMDEAWSDMAPDIGAKSHVEFLCYQQLFKTHESVGKPRFEAWYPAMIKQRKKNGRSVAFLENKDKVYQEFRLCSGYSKAEYQDLGVRQASIEKELRSSFYDLYVQYKSHLGQEIDLAFYEGSIECDPYDLIIVDESQDLSLGQLKTLYHMAKNRAVAFCMSSNQSLNDTCPKRMLLSQMLYCETGNQFSDIELLQSYRCSLQVTHAANHILTLKQHLIGGVLDKVEPRQMTASELAHQGYLFIAPSETLSQAPWLIDRIKSSQCAIVTLPEHKEAAKANFPQAEIILTPKEIKGLEYDTILAYNLFPRSLSKAAQIKLKGQAELSSQHLVDREDMSSDLILECDRLCNRLLVAFTRAKQTLVICSDNTNLPEKLMLDGLHRIKNPLTDCPDTIKETTPEDWLKEVKRLIKRPLTQDIGSRLYKRHIDPTDGAFEHFIADEQARLHAKASLPNPVAITITPPLKQPASVSFTNVEQISKKKKKKSQAEKIERSSVNTDNLTGWYRYEEGRALLKSMETIFPAKALEKFQMPEYGTDETLAPLYYLSENVQKGHLLRILEEKSHILTQIPLEAWIRPVTTEGDNKNVSPICLLCAKKEGIAILVLLLKNLPQLFAQIPVEAWASKTSAVYNNCSMLFLLCTSMEGRAFLGLFFQRAPEIFTQIPAHAWSQHYTATGQMKNVSPLFLMSQSGEGPTILMSLLQQAPDIFTQIPAEAWIRPLTRAAGHNENCSPLFALSESLDGQAFLILLLKKVPQLFSQIPVQGWTRFSTKAAGSLENISPLVYLSQRRGGIEFLTLLLELLPQIFTQIPAEAWTRPMSAVSGINYNTSPLYILSQDVPGRLFLASLFKRVPQLFKQIPPLAWYRLTGTADTKDHFSTIYRLSVEHDGHAILFSLLQNAPEVFAQIPMEAWQNPYKDGFEYTSIGFLSDSETGRTITRAIFAAGRNTVEMRNNINLFFQPEIVSEPSQPTNNNRVQDL